MSRMKESASKKEQMEIGNSTDFERFQGLAVLVNMLLTLRYIKMRKAQKYGSLPPSSIY